jgi:hypothetical protein
MDDYPQIDLNVRSYSEYLAVQALSPSTRPTDLPSGAQPRHFLPRIVAGISPRVPIPYTCNARPSVGLALFSEACRNGEGKSERVGKP